MLSGIDGLAGLSDRIPHMEPPPLPPHTANHDRIYTTILGAFWGFVLLGMVSLTTLMNRPGIDDKGRWALSLARNTEACFLVAALIILIVRHQISGKAQVDHSRFQHHYAGLFSNRNCSFHLRVSGKCAAKRRARFIFMFGSDCRRSRPRRRCAAAHSHGGDFTGEF